MKIKLFIRGHKLPPEVEIMFHGRGPSFVRQGTPSTRLIFRQKYCEVGASSFVRPESAEEIEFAALAYLADSLRPGICQLTAHNQSPVLLDLSSQALQQHWVVTLLIPPGCDEHL